MVNAQTNVPRSAGGGTASHVEVGTDLDARSRERAARPPYLAIVVMVASAMGIVGATLAYVS